MSKLEQLDKLLVGYGAEPLENKEESQVEHFSSTLTSVKEVFRFSLSVPKLIHCLFINIDLGEGA